MAKYRKKVLVDAIRFRGGEQPGELVADVVAGKVIYPEDGTMLIQTLEGVLIARPGDWILRGPEGELWPVRADIFEKTYELAEGAPAFTEPNSYDSREAR